MTAKVGLNNVSEQLEMIGQESGAYLNKLTGELHVLMEDGAGGSSVLEPQRGYIPQPRVGASPTLGKRYK